MLGGFTLLACFIGSVGSPLDCSDQSDPVVETCCSAQSAWLLMEAAGGCGGAGATESQCSRASDLCESCRAAVEHQDLAALNFEQKLSTLDISFLEMTLRLAQVGQLSGSLQRGVRGALRSWQRVAAHRRGGVGDLPSMGAATGALEARAQCDAPGTAWISAF